MNSILVHYEQSDFQQIYEIKKILELELSSRIGAIFLL
jgi:hypothetical protein